MLHLHDNVAFTFNDMEILGAKRFTSKGFELGSKLSEPNRSIDLFSLTVLLPHRSCM